MHNVLELYFFLTVTIEKNKHIFLTKDEYDALKPFIIRNVRCAFRQRHIQDYLLDYIKLCIDEKMPIENCGYEMIRRAKDDLLRFEVRLLERAMRQVEDKKTKKDWL